MEEAEPIREDGGAGVRLVQGRCTKKWRSLRSQRLGVRRQRPYRPNEHVSACQVSAESEAWSGLEGVGGEWRRSWRGPGLESVLSGATRGLFRGPRAPLSVGDPAGARGGSGAAAASRPCARPSQPRAAARLRSAPMLPHPPHWAGGRAGCSKLPRLEGEGCEVGTPEAPPPRGGPRSPREGDWRAGDLRPPAPGGNRKVVDYSQFQESDDADEDYGRDSGPPTKKIRSSPREAKNKRRSGKNSQEDSEDSEEKDVKIKKDDSHSAEDSEDEKDDHKNVRQQRQAASKAASKQREMLMEDVGSEEEQEEEDEAPFQEKDSGSDEDFLMEDDDDSDYGSSKKKNKKMVKKSKPERKEKKMPKPRLKATVTPSPVKGKGKVGRPTASKTSKEKTPSPKDDDEEPESPPEKKTSASPPPEKSGDEGSEDEAQSGED
ncbi:nuclear ubiquitous casein and cyclin-dependent kinase substrate 1 [Ctenodactylus gundi]